jgi:hypothetical protein
MMGYLLFQGGQWETLEPELEDFIGMLERVSYTLNRLDMCTASSKVGHFLALLGLCRSLQATAEGIQELLLLTQSQPFRVNHLFDVLLQPFQLVGVFVAHFVVNCLLGGTQNLAREHLLLG